jgi:hypothetical protein
MDVTCDLLCWITMILACMLVGLKSLVSSLDYRSYMGSSVRIWSLWWLFLYLCSYNLDGSVTHSIVEIWLMEFLGLSWPYLSVLISIWSEPPTGDELTRPCHARSATAMPTARGQYGSVFPGPQPSPRLGPWWVPDAHSLPLMLLWRCGSSEHHRHCHRMPAGVGSRLVRLRSPNHHPTLHVGSQVSITSWDAP